MLAPSPLTFEFMRMASYAPATFHELPDDEGESDGSNIGDVAPLHRPSRECAMADAPGQPLVVVESTQTHTLWTRVRRPSRLYKRTPRNYDNGGRTSCRLHRHSRCGTLRPMRRAWRVAPGVALVRSSTTS